MADRLIRASFLTIFPARCGMRRSVIMKLLFLSAFLLIASNLPAFTEDTQTAQFTVDAAGHGRPISRFVYGVNLGLDAPYSNLTLTRMGGNRWTAYNWTNNASNAGSDWQFQNDALLGGGDAPGGAVAPGLKSAGEHGAGIIVTVPIAGYVAADKNGGGDVRKTGPDYLLKRFRKSLPRKGSAFTLDPSPKSEVVYQDEFVNWVINHFPYGVTDSARPIFFSLDNEPDLWSSTHAEIHPANPTYEEMVQRTIDYSRAIKDAVPAAIIFGPVNYGWQGYVRLQNAADANNRDFQEFYLQKMAAAEKQYGKRLLDVFDVHWYSEAQGGGKRIIGNEATPEVVAARVQAPRSLWDPAYTETSWITKDSLHGPIALLPRLQRKIDQFYPGTKFAITEYNYGGGEHISGAIAQADALGIFGREGIYAACQWPMSDKQPFVAAAFQMFRNFDGKNGAFGDTSVPAGTDNAADTSLYASTDSNNPKHVVLVVINKTARPIEGVFKLSHVAPGAVVSIYQLTDAGASPKSSGSMTISDPGNFHYTLPPYSVSTLNITMP